MLYVVLLYENNEVSGHIAVYYRYSFLRAINSEEEDVMEVIKIIP